MLLCKSAVIRSPSVSCVFGGDGVEPLTCLEIGSFGLCAKYPGKHAFIYILQIQFNQTISTRITVTTATKVSMIWLGKDTVRLHKSAVKPQCKQIHLAIHFSGYIYILNEMRATLPCSHLRSRENWQCPNRALWPHLAI